MGKTEQIQIRVTREEKAALKRLARRAGQGVSAFVLSRALPRHRLRYGELLRELHDEAERRYVLAELNDLLAALGSSEFLGVVDEPPDEALSAYLRNYLAAMVEHAARQKGVPPPRWVGRVEPLTEPHFAAALPGLRVYLLRASPVAYRKRNLFIDSAVGSRV